MVCRRVGSWAFALLVAARASSAQTAQPHTEALVEWPVYGGSLAAQFYSPPAQIDARNVKDLKVAWRRAGANFRPNPEPKSEATPLMIRGGVFAAAGQTRHGVAIRAKSGETPRG